MPPILSGHRVRRRIIPEQRGATEVAGQRHFEILQGGPGDVDNPGTFTFDLSAREQDARSRLGSGKGRNYTAGMRIVGLDVGERRIGIAISDATRTLARPVGVLSRGRSDDEALRAVADAIAELAREEDGVEAIVVGLPRRLDGSASEMTTRVQALAGRIATATGLAVRLQDERLSSREAESRLALREKDWRVRKQRLDAAAAAIILQDYLDSGERQLPTDPTEAEG